MTAVAKMWYGSSMPKELPREELTAAQAAVEYAQSVRRLHRRKTDKGDPARERDIELALQRIKDAMRPLRTLIGQFPYGPQTTTAERNRLKVYAASQALQSERRKLWKMKNKRSADA